MATLNGVAGEAHVEVNTSLPNWLGYIILTPDLTNFQKFDLAGPAARGIYEGPAILDGRFFLIRGNVRISNINFSSSELRVEFIGHGQIYIIHPLSVISDDHLPFEKINLSVHSQAILKFNEKGDFIVSCCKESKSQEPSPIRNPRFPEMYISGTITSNDIKGEIDISMRDMTGKKLGRFFNYQEKQIGLENENYVDFSKLCESIHKAIKPAQVISVTAVEDQVFGWIRERFLGNTQKELIEYIVPELEAKVVELEVWVPIAGLRVESDVYIGNITIRPITVEDIDRWRDERLSHTENKENENITEFFDKKFKKQLQGWPAGVIRLIAEPIAAREIALHETERSLAMLRVFFIAALTPKVTCYSALMGRENYETVTAFMFKNSLFISYNQNTVDHGREPWNLDKNSFQQIYDMGLGILSGLLQKTSLTEFQKSIIDSLTLYSQATAEKELSNKLVYLLAALEGIFLKNDTESIQQNLGERIATLIGKELKDKKDIIKNIKTTYGLRSRFLHHAFSIDDSSELEKFMFNAWVAVNSVINNYDRFSTKEDFVSAIDDRKLAPKQNSG